MEKRPFLGKLLKSVWVLASLGLLAIAILWRLTEEKSDVGYRPSARLPAPATARRSLQSPPRQLPSGMMTEMPPEPEEQQEEPSVDAAPIQASGIPPEAPENVPFVDLPALPPCPRPLAPLRAAWLQRDWKAVHAVLDPVLSRKDCSQGSWMALQWASQEAVDIQRLKGSLPGNRSTALRSLSLAILAAFDSPQSLREVNLDVVDVAPAGEDGFSIVEGVEVETQARLFVLTRQAVESGGAFAPTVINDPDASDGFHTVDLSLLAPFMERSLYNKLRKNPVALERFPEEMRSEIESFSNFDSMSKSASFRGEVIRKTAVDYLALHQRTLPETSAKHEQMQRQLQDREDALYKALENFFSLER